MQGVAAKTLAPGFAARRNARLWCYPEQRGLLRRRISATSVAQRVAAERGEALGETVGYQIRMEAKRSAATRLLFWCDNRFLATHHG